jgi:hypothetical protein
MEPIGSSRETKIILSKYFPEQKKGITNNKQVDTLTYTKPSRAFDKIESFLNLGKPDRLNFTDLNAEEKEEFLKILTKLIKAGVVGYEILEVDGKPEKHFIVNQIGDKRTQHSKLYKEDNYYNRH